MFKRAIGKDKVTDMLHYKNFNFDTKEDFKNYIEKRMTDYWKNHNDSFSRVCEDLDSWDGFLGDDRLYQMCDLDDLLGEKKPSEVIQMLGSDFDYSDDYFYWDGYGELCSTNEKRYFDKLDYSEVFSKLIDDYGEVFTAHYGCAYYNLFNDVYDIVYRYDENEIQDYMNYDYYDYLFEDDNDFFSDDDLDE